MRTNKLAVILIAAASAMLALIIARYAEPIAAFAQSASNQVMGVSGVGSSLTGVKPVYIGGNNSGSAVGISVDSSGNLQGNAADRTATGTIGALNGVVSLSTTGMGTVGIKITGTWNQTLSFQASVDGTNWEGLSALALAAGTFANQGAPSTTTANGAWFANVSGFRSFRVISTVYTSGTATVVLEGNQTAFFTWTQATNNFATTIQGTEAPGSVRTNPCLAVGGQDNAGIFRIPNVTPSGSALGSTPSVLAVGGTDNANNAHCLNTDTSGRLNVFTLGLVNGTGSLSFFALDSLGRMQQGDTAKTTYSAANAFTVAATPTDVIRITGSASKTITVRSISVVGSQTTAGLVTAFAIKRSANDTSGVFVAATAVPNDSSNAAATATVGHYTTSPTLGAAVGSVRCETFWVPVQAATGSSLGVKFDFAKFGLSQGIVLRGAAQELDINLNGLNGGGLTLEYFIEWTEE